ncbi:MAG: GntR family transcriptional regulator [Firmicutes bacterium]|nr:GntR family transcriptional regulator [Bacillota bacterium]
MNDKTRQVFDILKQDILYGRLEDGEHITETALAEKYSVSRIHVKAALEQLAIEQLVEYKRNRGFFVTGLTAECIDEINKLRKALTTIVAENIIDTVTDEQLDELDKIIDRSKAFYEAGLNDDAIAEDTIFYNLFQSYSSCTRVVSILEMYNDYIFAIINRSVQTKADYEKGVNYLRRFVESLRSRNMDNVREVVQDQDDYKAVEI